jgi:hypothetical protein
MLSTIIERVVPGWMRLKPYEHWLGLAFTIAAGLDALMDAAFDATLSDMPGQVDQPNGAGYDAFSSIDALPLIGRDRRIAAGFEEPPDVYAAELRAFRESWRRSATAFEFLDQVAAILSPTPPRLRIVSALGQWWTRETDGTYRLDRQDGQGFTLSPTGVWTLNSNVPPLWDWDSTSVPPPPDQGDDLRTWLIIYAPCNLPHLKGDEGTFGDGKAVYGPDGVIGCNSSLAWINLIRGVAADFRPAGVLLSHIILALDPDSFDPTVASPTVPPGSTYTALPDGNWGWHSKPAIVGGVLVRVRGRLPTARYALGIDNNL